MEQKSILITGCSSGIGLAAATALKQRGYRVFATARKLADVDKLKSLGLESLQLDVNDSASIQAALEQVLSLTNGTLYALFNNAGFLQAGAIEDLTRDMQRAQFETNVFGAMELVSRVLPIMRKQGYGRIIQNSSILGVVTIPYYGAYNATKFALEGYTHTLRQELAGTNIHAILINPGPIVTNFWDNAYQQYQHTIRQQSDSAYQNAYQKLEKEYLDSSRRSLKLAQSPEAVTKKLIHALESKRPCVHYYIGWPAQLVAVLRLCLPQRVLDWILMR